MPSKWNVVGIAGLLFISVLSSGCTTLREYIDNHFKVGPQYVTPPAPVAKDWIDANDVRIRKDSDDLAKWWTVFNDPVLNDLICYAYHQNLTLRQAGFRVLQARAQLAIDTGNLLPQKQQMTGDYTRNALSIDTANGHVISPFGPVSLQQFFSQWDLGFNLSWEIDFWGRLRRAIEASADNLDASVANYDDVLVTLLADVATNYVQYRTFQERIKLLNKNVDFQRDNVRLAEAAFKAGTVDEVGLDQLRSTLANTESQIPELEISLRQANNQLCILLGISAEDLQPKLGPGSIPTAPPEVVVGIPADLLRRRPDVRRAERQAAAQSAEIGVAEAEFYPHIAINGSIGYSADRFTDLFKSQALSGIIGPAFQWNILNYGRILNNVRLQDAKFQELVAAYQNTVLSAGRDVEDGLITFLRAQQRAKSLAVSVATEDKAVKFLQLQNKIGTANASQVDLLEQNKVEREDTYAQARGEIALGMIQTYRALGGGWQLRCTGCETTADPSSCGPQLPAVTAP